MTPSESTIIKLQQAVANFINTGLGIKEIDFYESGVRFRKDGYEFTIETKVKQIKP